MSSDGQPKQTPVPPQRHGQQRVDRVDAVAPSLSPREIAARREATRDAIASARIEGLEVSAGARVLMDLYDQGQIGEEELIARIRQLHVGR